MLFLAPYLGDGGIDPHMLTLGRELRKVGWEVAICSGGVLPGQTHLDIVTGQEQVTRYLAPTTTNGPASVTSTRRYRPARTGFATCRSCS